MYFTKTVQRNGHMEKLLHFNISINYDMRLVDKMFDTDDGSRLSVQTIIIICSLNRNNQ